MLSRIKKKHTFAVHFEKNSLKCAQIIYCPKTAIYQLTHAAEFFFPQDLDQYPARQKIEAFAQALPQLIPKKIAHTIIPPSIMTALAETDLISKIFYVDSTIAEKTDDLEGPILAAAEKQLSLTLESLAFDFKKLPPPFEANAILFMATHQEKIHDRLTLFKKAKLRLKVIEGENYALARACLWLTPAFKKIFHEKSWLLMEIEKTQIHFVIFKNFLPMGFYTKTLETFIPEDEITDLLTLALNILPNIFATYSELSIHGILIGGKKISPEFIRAFSLQLDNLFHLPLFQTQWERLKNLSALTDSVFHSDNIQWLRCFGLALRGEPCLLH